MTEVIAILALCISTCIGAPTLFILWRNRVERRHAEIAKLRSDFLMKLSAIHQRLFSVRMHLETARLEARNMRNSDSKYFWIEKIPPMIERIEQQLRRSSELKDEWERLDTMKEATRGDILMRFQSSEHDLRLLEQHAGELEQDALKILIFILSQQEEANHPEHLK